MKVPEFRSRTVRNSKRFGSFISYDDYTYCYLPCPAVRVSLTNRFSLLDVTRKRLSLSCVDHNVYPFPRVGCFVSCAGLSASSTAGSDEPRVHGKLLRDTELVCSRPPVFGRGRFLPHPQPGNQLYRRFGMRRRRKRLGCVLHPGRTLVERYCPCVNPSEWDLSPSSCKSDLGLQ